MGIVAPDFWDLLAPWGAALGGVFLLAAAAALLLGGDNNKGNGRHDV